MVIRKKGSSWDKKTYAVGYDADNALQAVKNIINYFGLDVEGLRKKIKKEK